MHKKLAVTTKEKKKTLLYIKNSIINDRIMTTMGLPDLK